MLVRPSRRVAAAFTTLALGAGIVAAATQASADTTTTPPWEPDASSVGTLSFYDASGAAITKGSTTSGSFAAFAVASKTVRSGDVSARLEIANPQKGADATKWYRTDAGVSTYPNSAAPSAVTSAAAGAPVWSAPSSEPTLSSLISGFAANSDASYKNVVQVRLVTANSAGAFTQQYATADLLIDPTAGTWTELYPTNATGGGTTPTTHATSIGISASAAQVTFGQKVTISAHLADTDASNAAIANASLTLKQRTTATGDFTTVTTATTDSSGNASVAVTPGTYRQFEWTYAGSTSGTQAYAASVSPPARVLVAQAVSGYVTSYAIKSGANVKFYGTVSPVLANETIYLQVLSGGVYKNVPGVTGVIKNQKLPNGKTTYGYVLSLNPKTKTSYTLRAYAPATKNNVVGASVAHIVRVS